MIQSLLFASNDKTISSNLPIREWEVKIDDLNYVLWIDLSGPPTDEITHILEKVFSFHPLVVEDALEESHIPRVDNWEQFIYLTLRCAAQKSGDELAIEIPELDVFIGSNYMITYHSTRLTEIESLYEKCENDPRFLEEGPGKLLYFLSDKLVNQYAYIVDNLSDMIDQIEDDIFDRPQSDTLSHIFTLKRNLLLLRRTFLPQREIFNKIARNDFSVIPESINIYFRDIYDHMLRMELISESLRDLVSGALDTYLSVVNNRMNDVMKTLTIITTLFMPLSFITGFFGMNFFQPVINLQVWTGKIVFFIILAFLFITPFGMFIWMRNRKWM